MRTMYVLLLGPLLVMLVAALTSSLGLEDDWGSQEKRIGLTIQVKYWLAIGELAKVDRRRPHDYAAILLERAVEQALEQVLQGESTDQQARPEVEEN